MGDAKPQGITLGAIEKQKQVEQEGIWQEVMTSLGKFEVQIAYWAGVDFRTKLQRILRRWKIQHSWNDKKPIPPEVDDALYAEALVGTTLRAFRGIVDDAGNPVPSNEQTMHQLLQWVEAREQIVERAKEHENFVAREAESAQGN